jgi:hypothetical protein
MGEKRNAYRLLEGKSEGKISLGRSRQGGWRILKLILERDRMGCCELDGYCLG